MDLELILNWDKTIPFESFDEYLKLEDRDSVKISVDISKAGKTLDSKKRYEGFVSTMGSATSFAFQVVCRLLRNIERKEKDYTNNLNISQYDLAEDGFRVFKISSEKIANTSSLMLDLKNLERRWYIEPRNEKVNACDYWDGFFRANKNLWTGSRYPHGNPAEKARQLAYELKQDIRKLDRASWFFPGYIGKFSRGDYSLQQKILIDGMNSILKNSSHIGKEDVIFGLRDHAQRYERLS